METKSHFTHFSVVLENEKGNVLGILVTVRPAVHVRELFEPRAPVTQVVVLLVSLRGHRLQRAQGVGHGAGALVGVGGQGVVGRGCGVRIVFL